MLSEVEAWSAGWYILRESALLKKAGDMIL